MPSVPRRPRSQYGDCSHQDEVADLLRVSKTSVYRLVERRALPFFRVSGLLRFDQEDIEAFLAPAASRRWVNSNDNYEHQTNQELVVGRLPREPQPATGP